MLARESEGAGCAAVVLSQMLFVFLSEWVVKVLTAKTVGINNFEG